MGILLFLIVGLALAYAPSFVIWWLAWKYLPHRYTFTPSRMTGVCMILAFLTAAILNLELKGGIITFIDSMLELTLVWTFMLLPMGVLKMPISQNNLWRIHATVLVSSIILMFIALIISSAGIARHISTSQEIQISKFSALIIPSILSVIVAVFWIIKTEAINTERIHIYLLTPLLGAIFYIVLIVLYFYDQIIAEAKLLNILTTLWHSPFPPSHIRGWSPQALFEVRLIQTLISGWLVFYGFFTAMSLGNSIPLARILLTVLLLTSILFILNKILKISLHDILGNSLYSLLLITIPVVAVKLIRRNICS